MSEKARKLLAALSAGNFEKMCELADEWGVPRKAVDEYLLYFQYSDDGRYTYPFRQSLGMRLSEHVMLEGE